MLRLSQSVLPRFLLVSSVLFSDRLECADLFAGLPFLRSGRSRAQIDCFI